MKSTIIIRVTAAEKQTMARAAKQEHLPLSTWLRQKALIEAFELSIIVTGDPTEVVPRRSSPRRGGASFF